MILIMGVDRSRRSVQIDAARRLYVKGVVREVIIVCWDDVDLALGIDMCRELNGQPRCSTMSFEDAVEKLSIYSEVVLLPMGRTNMIASLAHNLGRSGTKLVIATYRKGRVELIDGRTLRRIRVV